MQILITRPTPSATDTAEQLKAAGYDPLVAPVLLALSLPAQPVDIQKSDIALATSPQAAQALTGWSNFHQVPTLAVGDRTAQLLRESGFTNVESLDGDAAQMLDHIRGQYTVSRRFHLLCAPTTGQWIEQKLTDAGYTVLRTAVYEIHAADALTPEAIAALREGRISYALFYSAFSVECFLRLAEKANIMGNLAAITACCLSASVATAASKAAWKNLLTAASPNSAALQALLPKID